MGKNFYDFVSWLEYDYGKLTNRDIIYDYYSKLENLIKRNNIISTKEGFRNEFVAYIYEHSLESSISKKIDNLGCELPPDSFYNLYESLFIDFFYEMKEDTLFNSFNILDSNEKVQQINFLDLIERNIEIIDDNLEEEEEESDFSDYDYY